jgi:hypothetical protein
MKLILVSIQFMCLSILTHTQARAGDIVKEATSNGYKIELHLLGAEPFYTKQEVQAKNIMAGMLILGGEKPVKPDDPSHPNHHLVVHVFDAKTSKVISNAKITMRYQSLNAQGQPTGKSITVPVVEMEAIGMGAKSIHYGNNVSMEPGSYEVFVTLKGNTTKFMVDVPKYQ